MGTDNTITTEMWEEFLANGKGALAGSYLPVPDAEEISALATIQNGFADAHMKVGGIGRVSMGLGTTADVLYGGDVSGDAAGMGIALASANGDHHFAFPVYADDADVALADGWVSTVFGSMVIYHAVTPSKNLSAFGVSGQLHVGANVSTIGNLAGIYGVAETDSGVTITGNFFGGTFGATVPSGATLDTGYYTGGIIISGSYDGTISGKAVGIFLQNPGSTKQFDAAFAFGQDSKMAGVVTASAVGGSQTHKLKVLVGGNLMYMPLYTA